jgi:hypothetical protein
MDRDVVAGLLGNVRRHTSMGRPIVGKEYLYVFHEYVPTDDGMKVVPFVYKVVLVNHTQRSSVCGVRITELPAEGSFLGVSLTWKLGEVIVVYLPDLKEWPVPGKQISYHGTLPKI